jgi:sugar phosphate isomerase/epimerase
MTAPLEIKKGNARIRIGYRSPGLTGKLSPDEKMKLCIECGMSIIEPQIAPKEFPTIDDAKAYKEAADKHGITITSAGILLPYQNEDDRDEVNAYGDYALEVTDVLGVDYLFTLVNHPPENIPHQETWDLVKSRLHSFVEKAKKKSIVVSLEPEWFLGSVERVVKMITEVDHENFQLINFDATNFFTNGSDPRDCVRDYHSRIINGHIKDGFYRTGKVGESKIGTGEVPWKEIFEVMLSTGKDYTMHIEHCGQPEQIKDATTFIRSVIDSIE